MKIFEYICIKRDISGITVYNRGTPNIKPPCSYKSGDCYRFRTNDASPGVPPRHLGDSRFTETPYVSRSSDPVPPNSSSERTTNTSDFLHYCLCILTSTRRVVPRYVKSIRTQSFGDTRLLPLTSTLQGTTLPCWTYRSRPCLSPCWRTFLFVSLTPPLYVGLESGRGVPYTLIIVVFRLQDLAHSVPGLFLPSYVPLGVSTVVSSL